MVELIANATWEQIEECLDDPDIQLGLFGPPGIGKTSACARSADRRTKGWHKIQFHSEYSPSEAIGFYAPGVDEESKQQKFIWVPGPADLAYRKGEMLILDEIVEASGPMKTYMYGLLDRGPGGDISYVGRKFRQRKGYQAVATMNEVPTEGALPPALLDRFDAWFQVLHPHPMLLDMLEPDLREMCVAAYMASAEPPTKPGEIWDPMRGPDITFRILLAFQKLRQKLPLPIAAKAACYGDDAVAYTFLEILSLSIDAEDDEEPDSDEDVLEEDEEDEELELDDGSEDEDDD